MAVALSSREVADYYEGFSNGTLWPLYHDVIATPEFHREWWDAYVTVNQRFADQTAQVAGPGAVVWVQDYQLQLVPRMLRELRPDLRIGFFLHIPFPPTELYQQLPWRNQILEGMLGADLVGFQLVGGAQNFVRLVRQRLQLETHRDRVRTTDGRTVVARAYPIAIDAKGLHDLAASPEAAERAAEIRRDLGDHGCCSSGSTGSITPRGCWKGSARSASWSRKARSIRTRRCWSSSRSRHANGSTSTGNCATNSTGWWVGSTARSGGSAGRS